LSSYNKQHAVDNIAVETRQVWQILDLPKGGQEVIIAEINL
jgi:hypothetical protein